jgi:hypothetical protein
MERVAVAMIGGMASSTLPTPIGIAAVNALAMGWTFRSAAQPVPAAMSAFDS